MQAHQLCGQSADGRGRTLFARELHRGIEILEQRAHVPFHRFETALGHLRGEDLQWLRIGETTGQRFGNQAGIDPGLFGQRHHFGNHQRIAGDDHLIAGLGHLPGANAAHVGNALTEVEQHRAHPIQIRRCPTDHDCQATRLGTDHAAGHRRIEPAHAGLVCQFGRHLARRGRFQTGKIHQQLAFLCALSDTAGAKHHLAHHRRVGQTEHHHVRVFAQFGRGHDLPGAGFDQGCALGRVAVPHGQRVTRGQQTPAHRQAHQADSGKAQRR